MKQVAIEECDLKAFLKEHKALEIIKNKQVNIKDFITFATLPIVDTNKKCIRQDLQLKTYNDSVVDYSHFNPQYTGSNRCLDDNEWELLKEVLL